MRKLYGAIRELKQWPGSGRPGREDETREILFSPMPYVAVYRVTEETIEVMRFITLHRADLSSLRRFTKVDFASGGELLVAILCAMPAGEGTARVSRRVAASRFLRVRPDQTAPFASAAVLP